LSSWKQRPAKVCEQPVVPDRDLGEPVVGDPIGAGLLGWEVSEAQRRDLAPAELTTRAEPAVPGDHVVVAIDQDRDVEVESLDAIGDLPDLLLGVLTRVRPRRSDDKQSLNLNWIASYVRAISNSYNAQLLHS
jgi:hypothetical protein